MTVKTKKEKIISVTLTTIFNIALIIAATMTAGWEIAIGKGIVIFVVIMSELASFECGEAVILPFICCFTIVLGLVCLKSNEQIYNHAVELYNNGQYEEALEEFDSIKNYNGVDEYIETVVRLKGTDVEIIEDDN